MFRVLGAVRKEEPGIVLALSRVLACCTHFCFAVPRVWDSVSPSRNRMASPLKVSLHMCYLPFVFTAPSLLFPCFHLSLIPPSLPSLLPPLSLLTVCVCLSVCLSLYLSDRTLHHTLCHQAISPPPIQFQTQNSEAAHGLLLSCCNFKILVFYFALFCKTGSYTAQVGLEIPSQ